MAFYYGTKSALEASTKTFGVLDLILEYDNADPSIVKLKTGPRTGTATYNNLSYLTGSSTKAYAQNTKYSKDDLVYNGDILRRVVADYVSDNTQGSVDDSFILDLAEGKLEDITEPVEVPICLGSIKTDNSSDFPQNPMEGNWVLIENCVNTAPGQAGIGVYHESTGWQILAIPSSEFIFPEPMSDGKLYFRQVDLGDTEGHWQAFSAVDGDDIEVTIKTLRDTVDGNTIPAARELVYDSEREILVIGDGTTKLSNLQAFYAKEMSGADIISKLGYTPESSANKGQPYGYAPLDATGRVPTANLPDSVTQTYSKAQIDQKDADTLDSATLLVNTEANRAKGVENGIIDDLTSHVDNTVMHVTQNDKDKWDAKVDESALQPFTTHINTSSIHVTQEEKDKWNGMNAAYYVTRIEDLPATGLSVGNMGYVQTSAPGVTPVVCDQYIWTGTKWELYSDSGVSIAVDWGNIINKPSSTALAIDNAVAYSHSHTNIAALNKIGQTAGGSFTFDGVEVGVKVIFYSNDNELPYVGEEDTLYVVYEDSRVRNYPSISIYRDSAFQVLGRGLQEAAPVVGELSILQAEYFSVPANSTYKISITADQYFCSLPVEILKEIPGKTDETRVVLNIDDPTNFQYNDQVLTITPQNKLVIEIDEFLTENYIVGEGYYCSSVDIDTSYFKDVDSIE